MAFLGVGGMFARIPQPLLSFLHPRFVCLTRKQPLGAKLMSEEEAKINFYPILIQQLLCSFLEVKAMVETCHDLFLEGWGMFARIP